MTLIRLLEVEGLNALNIASQLIIDAPFAIVIDPEDTVLSTSKYCLAEFLVFFSKRVVHYSETTPIIYGQANEDGHSRKISFDEIAGTIERVDPDDGILCAKGREAVFGDILLIIVLS